jgi:Uma2 family endonuclease
LHTIGKKAVLGVPSLLVEVLSPSTARVDRVKKLGIYARLGVPEYWIVDPEANTTERCSDPSGDHYRDVEKFDGDMLAATLPGLALSFKQIFR